MGVNAMVNSIIEAISIALNREFGDGYRIYADDVEQGLTEPCFFVACVNCADRLYFGKRYFRENRFCIRYYPADRSRGKEECSRVAGRLFNCLEWLTVEGDLTMGTKLKSETADGVLSFFVNYDMFVYRMEEEQPTMGTLTENAAVKRQ